MSRFLSLLFSVLVFLSFILYDIPFSYRRVIVFLLAVVSVGLSILSVSVVVRRGQKSWRMSMQSWVLFLGVLVVLPLVRTPLAVVPLESKALLFTALLVMISSHVVEAGGGRQHQTKTFYWTVGLVWSLLILYGVLGESDVGELTKTGLLGGDFGFGFAYAGIYESANHFASLFGFLSMLLYAWFSNLLVRIGVALTALVVFLSLDANVALASFIVILLFERVVFAFRWFFVVSTIFFPLLFGLFSAALFAFLGVDSELLISMNNRLPMWSGLLAELQAWSPISHVFGQGWYSNYNSSTFWIYEGIFGIYYSGLKTAHSTSLQIIMDTGFFGFLVWLVFIGKHLCQPNGGFKRMSRYFGPMSFVLLTGVSESLIGVYMPSLFLLLCIFVLLIGTKKLDCAEN